MTNLQHRIKTQNHILMNGGNPSCNCRTQFDLEILLKYKKI